jgi:hypothetical protein
MSKASFRVYLKAAIPSRLLSITGFTTASLGLQVEWGFIDFQRLGQFFSLQLPPPQKASDLRVVLSAGHLNEVHTACQLRHHK